MAYCTSDNLKVLGYTWSDDDAAQITTICEEASNAIDAYCKQTFTAHANESELCHVSIKNGVVKLYPKNLTISSIDSISFVSFGNTITKTFANITWLPKEGCIIATTDAFNGEYLVTLVYSYGFEDGKYPSDLVRATMLACAPLMDNYFLAQNSNASMLKSLRQGQLRIERDNSNTGGELPKSAMAILNGGNGGLGYVRMRATR